MKIGVIGTGKLGKEVSCCTDVESYSVRENRNLQEFLNKTDVLIDCSATGFDERASQIDKPIIIATTQEIKNIPDTAVMFAPNGSFSWNLMHATAMKLARNGEYNFVINDIHHNNKRDAPSGTALRLINELKENGSNVEYASSRGFNVIGIHSITAYNSDELIKIEHQINNRAVFAKGLIKAAQWLVDKPTGVYDIAEVG